ncbi:MAG: hypothetical protein AABZ15_09940 [Nitrospirota bacterium]
MRMITKFTLMLVLLLLASPVLLLPGCGGEDVAKSQGCPSGSYLSNVSDSIAGSADVTFDQASSFGSPFPGGTILFSPVVFTIVDIGQFPRNNVCLIVYTDGFWYTDATYSTVITGVGPMNARAVVTNDTGMAVLYWSTELLPAANPVTIAAGPPVSYTPGADQTGQSWISVYSGASLDEYHVDWTVNGEPGP